jgi:hypothetical protein
MKVCIGLLPYHQRPRSLLIVRDEPGAQIGLQLIDPPVELLAERHVRLVEPLANAIGLRAARL